MIFMQLNIEKYYYSDIAELVSGSKDSNQKIMMAVKKEHQRRWVKRIRW